ncbi:methyltransferase family protein [Actinobacillus pleuropneumoniae]|uniref:methyltransferase family protein n=1 Tax=Actinobacillus pleuropneumoniae TaxID=715 RepID=UPI001F232646|nr:isoprenylcysteine carboxylmethyltransferase family protein [Actinobacillus pleuropneumoniae]UKH21187.1 isoprenylcysteine carboxylmethyltransferase family protein [Actinobacillus pleuropneumoniae]UPA20926.1 isoprenylcysteine carboxylmethyltransferase family protein [Actinobacillus pleuropneumoniae]
MELKLPPPLLFILSAILIYFLPQAEVYFIPKAFGYLFLLLSAIVGLMSVYAFFKEKTVFTPRDPTQTNKLVVQGIYRVSRNPMYLSLVLALIAWGIWLNSYFAILVIAGFMWYVDRFQIIPEERVLVQKFGKDFTDYQTKVRKWL